VERAALTRQPIFDSSLEICGYELFFQRTGQSEHGLVELAEDDFRRAVGPHPAFINLTEDFIVAGCAWDLPESRVVLEILEDVPPAPAVIEELGRLSRQGYRIALDDFSFAASGELVRVADIVKIDLLANDRSEVRDLVSRLRRSRVGLLAEKVETEDGFRFAQSLGFDYLQGYFLSRPQAV
jgi:EAL and modified HD-GYP domain-containing signal transduction protein